MPTTSTNPHLPFGENKNADWYGKDIISVKQFSRDDLEYVFGVAHESLWDVWQQICPDPNLILRLPDGAFG